MKLHIQKFLRETPGGVASLKELYAIDSKRHQEYPNLILMKYSQIDSPFGNPIVQEARGIILDEANNWNVVCYTFSKFFNVSEGLAAKIDWSTAVVQEKLDGSICQVFYYGNWWHVATSGTPDASGQVSDYGKTFKELFWETWIKQGWDTREFDERLCYAFELTGPLNRVVVDHKEAKLHLIGARNLNTLAEVSIMLQPEKYNLPKVYPLNSIDSCLKAAEGLNPLEHEGFVVVDASFNRVKIKSPAYVMLHHAKDSLSKRRMCEIVRKGEVEEFKIAIDSLPELKKIFDDVCQKHSETENALNDSYGKIKHIENQKEFALAAKEYGKGASILFQMRKEGLSAAACMSSPKLTLNGYMSVIGAQ